MENLFNLVLAFGLLLVGLMYYEGVWHKNRSKPSALWNLIDTDRMLFPSINNPLLFRRGDQLAALICFIGALLTALNGILSYAGLVPNISAIFFFGALFSSFPARVIFIISYKDSPPDKIPMIYPFRK